MTNANSSNAVRETAADLLKEIAKEREALIKAGKMKKAKPLPEITIDEIPYEIPDNWEWVRLSSCGIFISGYTPKNVDLSNNGSIPYFKVSDMNRQENKKYMYKTDLYLNDDVNTPKTYPKETIIYPKNGGALLTNKKRILLTDSVVDLNTGGYLPSPSLSLDYIYQYFLGIDFKDYQTGSTVPTLNQDRLQKSLIPIPPLSEQKKIVALLDDVLSRIDKVRENIERNIENAEEIYQKRLENVFHGALTSNGSPDSVDELLAEIQKERETLIKAGKMKKEKPLPPISDDEIPYSIPYTWKWVKMASISTKITDGEHKTPKRVDKYQGYYLLSARNVCNGYLQLDDVDYVDEDEYNNISRRCNPQYGDVLLSCSGSVGRCAIVPDDNHYVMVRSAAMISPLCVDSKFLMYTIQSPALQTQIKNSSKQTAQANLFQEPIRNLLVPLPPLSEQKKIASHLDELRKQTDALKARYTAKLQALDELKQSLLEKAFRGELT